MERKIIEMFRSYVQSLNIPTPDVKCTWSFNLYTNPVTEVNCPFIIVEKYFDRTDNYRSYYVYDKGTFYPISDEEDTLLRDYEDNVIDFLDTEEIANITISDNEDDE